MNNLSEEQISQSVAIIGMSGRFPGADTISAFWRNLVAGVCSLETLTDNALRASGVSDDILNNPRCIKRAGVLHNIDKFDAAFFNYSPREAELIDPQQRLFLECAWEAFEDAGYTPESVNGSVGVFAGAGMNYYFIKNLLSQQKRFEDIVDFLTFIGNDKDYLCSRVSYKLGLTGPSFVVNSACSSSLVAVQVGYQSLLTYQCDLALCGGVALQSPRARASLYHEGEIFSQDGCCRAFDKNADGIVFGEGLGLVMLKRTEDALRDNDHIYAIIRSAVVNNDGSAKAGFTAPGVESQSELIALAQDLAGVHPDDIAFIEAHGTGTKLGDAIEVNALTSAFRRKTSRRQFCALGSVKTNIGHLDVAAGITGLIKTALALENKLLPPSLHLTEENPELELNSSPFYVAKEPVTWTDNNLPLIAGLSSFGMGGTNVHLIMQEPPLPRSQALKNRTHYLLPLSAQTETALKDTRERLQKHITENRNLSIQDIAFTLQIGRRAFCKRWYAVCTNTEELLQLLSNDVKVLTSVPSENSTQPVIFAFSGQGSQYPGMGQGLYESEPVVRDVLDKARQIMLSETGEDLFTTLFPSSDIAPDTAAKTLARTVYTQPALFALEYAIARLFISFGITPSACIGHSIGEYTAAVIAGVFTFEQCMKIVIRRGRLMDSMQHGSMAYVALNEKELQPLINGNLVIALVNGPSSCVVSGPSDEITACMDAMQQNNIRCGLLQTSHAFHSPMMEEAANQFREFLDNITICRPSLPIISNVSGTWLTDEQCTSSQYWADQLRKTVCFSDGISELLSRNYRLFLEIGPGNTLSTLIGMHTVTTEAITAIPSLRHSASKDNDGTFFTCAIGKLWTAGISVDWSKLYSSGQTPKRIPLPAYPFERKRYWIEFTERSSTINDKDVSQKLITDNAHYSDESPVTIKQMIDLSSRESVTSIVSEAWSAVLGIDNWDHDESFLSLGGNSLMLSQIVARLNERLPYVLHMSFLMGVYTINEQVERLLEFGKSDPNAVAQTINEPIQHAEKETLSPAQQRLWFLCQLNRHSPAFNITHTFRIRGHLQTERLENALRIIIKRHSPLHSTFSQINGLPSVSVHEHITFSFPVIECTSGTMEENENLAAVLIRKEALVLYDLEQGPIFKFRLYRIASDEHIFVFFVHHIVSDGWSMAVILKELSTLYDAPEEKQEFILPDLKTNYFDYAAYMNRLEELPVNKDTVKFWKEYFKSGLPVLSLPTDFSRPKTMKYTAGLLSFVIPPELSKSITAYAANKKVTPFAIFLSVYSLLLYRYTRQERIIIGCPSAGRERVEFEPLIGLFLNMIPFNIELSSNLTLELFIESTYRNTARVFAQQNIQYGKLVEILQPERLTNINPVFQTMFSYNNYLFNSSKSSDVVFEPEKSDRGVSEYDLSLYIWSCGETLYGAFEYNDELFLESTINAIRSQFKTLLEAALKNPSLPIVKAPVFSDRELSEILTKKFESTCEVPVHETVHSLLDRALLSNRQNVALTDGIRILRYEELYTLSNQICNGLRSGGVETGTLIGVHMSRSINIIPVLLGILKAGAAYIPLDPFFPTERIDFMISDADLRFIITDITNGKHFSGNDAIHVLIYDDKRNDFSKQSTDLAGRYGDSETLAYILYTSGSTGAPKGVEIQHKSVVNFLMSMAKSPGISVKDNLLAITTISFDISGLELFLPLLAGATITLVDSLIASDAFELKKRLENSGATIIQATPTTWRMLLEAGWRNGNGLKILCGGEAMSRELADKLLATGAELWNMYGPTETTIWSSISRILPGEKEPDLGSPIDNTQFFFLDDALQEVPRGVIAELCIGGAGLAKGYHKKTELTKNKFVTISIDGKTIRVYRTGDLVRMRTDGTIEFLGRTDQQVKIRGYRIELEEIETLLNKHTTVKQAVVSTYTTASGKELVAYVQLNDRSQLDVSSIREHLGVLLPHFMIPATIIGIDKFPLTPNGKIDRNNLPTPQPDSHSDKNTITIQTARDDFEAQLIRIWEQFIGKKVRSIDDNYFELGGHSLLAVQIFNEIYNIYNLRLPLAVLIEHNTIRTFAAYLREIVDSSKEISSFKNIEKTNGSPASINRYTMETGAPVQGLQLGYNSNGRPMWVVPKQGQPNTYIPLVDDGSIVQNPFTPPPQKVLLPTPAQEAIWNLAHANKQANTASNEAISIRLTGHINEDALDKAIKGLPIIHEILRGHFSANGKELIIESHVDIPVNRHNIHLITGSDLPSAAVTFETDEAKRLFDLQNGPLIRVTILKTNIDEHIIILCVHSSIVDSWSLDTLIADLGRLYTSFATQSAPCSLIQHGFSDYVNYRTTPEFIEQKQNSLFYWHSILSLPPLPHHLPSIFPCRHSPANHTFKARIATCTLNNDELLKIRSFARRYGVSLFSVLLAGFTSRLQHLSNSDDITTGVSFAGQISTGMEKTAGRFVNVIPLRIRSSIGTDFSVLSRLCHNLVLNAGSNATLGIEEISRELEFSQYKKQSLVATRLNFVQAIAQDSLNFGDANVSYHPIPRCATPADLELCIIESSDNLQFIVYSNADCANQEWLDTFVRELGSLLIDNCTVKENITENNNKYTTAENDEEKFLAEVWKRVLGIHDVGAETNFFELGGHSLSTVQLLHEIFLKYNVKLPMSTLIEQNTIRTLATYLRKEISLPEKETTANTVAIPAVFSAKKHTWNTVVPFKREGELSPFFCVSGLGGNPMIFMSLFKLLGKNQPFFALQFRGVDGILQPHKTVEDIAAEFLADIRQIQKSGPYYIGGYSFGGLVAYEMIQQLLKNGEQAGGLVLIDTVVPHRYKRSLKKLFLTRLSNLLSKEPSHIVKYLKIRKNSQMFQKQLPDNNNELFKKRFDLVAKCNHEAGLAYKFAPIDTNVLYVKSAYRIPKHLNSQEYRYHETNEWDNLIASDRLDIRFVQTHHYELLNEPHVTQTAQMLTDGLATLHEKYRERTNLIDPK